MKFNFTFGSNNALKMLVSRGTLTNISNENLSLQKNSNFFTHRNIFLSFYKRKNLVVNRIEIKGKYKNI